MFNVQRTAVVITVIAIGAGLAWFLKVKLSPKQAANLITVPVKIEDIEETVLASGTLKPIKMVAVGAQVSGRVISLKVVVGQRIRLGDLIAQIDPVTKQNDLRTAEAALENIRSQRAEKQATLALAEASFARQQLTFTQRASSRADYETADATVKQTRAQIAALDAQTREVLQEELLHLMERPDERKTMVFITHSIDEAILLGDRIAVMSARPGRIKEVLDMPFGWPRSADAVRSDPRFTEIRLHIWHQLHTARPRSATAPREVA